MLDREIRIVRILDIDCFIDRTIERKKVECMHVRAGTNKDEVCLGRNTTPDRISALANFPTPSDQTSVRSFLGLCNQLAFFIPDYQHHTVSLRQLTGKGRSFLWLPEHQVEFDKLKSILSSNLVVWHFDQSEPVYLLTDASRLFGCLLYTSPSPRDRQKSRMPSSA